MKPAVELRQEPNESVDSSDSEPLESATQATREPGESPVSRRRGLRKGQGWLREPRTAVLVVLGVVVTIGGGRRLFQGWQARRALNRLSEPGVTTEEIKAAWKLGRRGLADLFGFMAEGRSTDLRNAAGLAISRLWAKDDLVAEEEQALIRRGYEVEWVARKRYPRALREPIPITVRFGVPFLEKNGPGISPANLEWSHRLKGAGRAALEEESSWQPGPGRFSFTIIPGDFEGRGPHRLVFQAKCRTHGLTSDWSIELPHMPFHFELDQQLAVDSLLASHDASRADLIRERIRLEEAPEASGDELRIVDLGPEMVLRNPPRLRVSGPLPCDLAHRVWVELEGVPGRIAAGSLVLSGQGLTRPQMSPPEPEEPRDFPIGPLVLDPSATIDRPGNRAMRVILEADPALGWTDPEVRSIWPGTIETNWAEARIIRR